MKALFFALAAAFVVSILSFTGASADGGNVGHVNHLGPYSTWDAAKHYVSYTCSYVHRTAVAGGFQEKETCQLADGAVLPKKPMTLCLPDVGGSWGSDYILATQNVWQYAQTWCETIMPSGTVTMVSFYKSP